MKTGLDFTIITPSYNYGRYIGDCLESVACQRGVTYEHLVMDAGSTDETEEIVARFPGVRLFQEPDSGMSEAINKGFRKARGEWVMWLNADDSLELGALLAVKEWAYSHPGADIIFGTYAFMDRSGAVTRRMHLLPYSRFISVHSGCYVPSTAAFFHRERVIEQGFLVDERFRIVMDNEYYARLSVAGKRFSYLPKYLARFRVHEDNLSKLGGMERGTIAAELDVGSRSVESWAIRRVYGVTVSRNYWNTILVDAILFRIAWLTKGVLKVLSRRPTACGNGGH